MAEGSLLYVDPEPWESTNMGPTEKKGMQGPSRCALCREQEDTIENLTNA